jgi:hypothetical protein
MTTTTENLAAALRSIIYTDVGGPDADKGAHIEALRSGIVALAAYDSEQQAPRQPQPLGDAPRGSL